MITKEILFSKQVIHFAVFLLAQKSCLADVWQIFGKFAKYFIIYYIKNAAILQYFCSLQGAFYETYRNVLRRRFWVPYFIYGTLLFTIKKIMLMVLANLYNKIYSQQDGNFIPKLAPFIKSVLKYKKTGQVLDIGAGYGQNTLFLLQKWFSVMRLIFPRRE